MAHTFACPRGDCGLFSLSKLDDHLTADHHLEHMCSECEESFGSAEEAKEHTLLAHENAQTFDDPKIRNTRIVDSIIAAVRVSGDVIEEFNSVIMRAVIRHWGNTSTEKLIAVVDSPMITRDFYIDCFEALKMRYDSGEKSIDLLCRLAKLCTKIGNFVEKEKRKDIIIKGKMYATEAWNTDSYNILAAHWAAVMSGKAIEYLEGDEKNLEMRHCRQYLDRAISIQAGKNAMYNNILGRWALSALEIWESDRQQLIHHYATPYDAIDDAIYQFRSAFDLIPYWIDNIVHLGKALLYNENKEAAIGMFQLALKMDPSNDIEKELLADALDLCSI
ncbi:Regulator of microtubule dynamics protein 1 [Caenorhabditis elegans]|uniref:Regulator of microtubule dynamics protein 1 n=1 Tax=Caenorhabditis elegans TaxID=6239 RepID=Q9XWK6_CAEEL|nr:C2H2-type domain-containing protein [Caenorhabditis elegans]CAA21653.1 C2H2-type domain-containing protein [Caenorhabditis elegans]|eukprot:NP_499432.1 SUPpressor [Caenorhabditis elegans]